MKFPINILSILFLTVLTLFTAGCPSKETSDSSPVCGNGVIDDGELCDGTNLGELTCSTKFGENAHTLEGLRCTELCTVDYSKCRRCGDGVLDEEEECDGVEFMDASCEDIWDRGGDVACGRDCSVSYVQCQWSTPSSSDYYSYRINDVAVVEGGVYYATVGTKWNWGGAESVVELIRHGDDTPYLQWSPTYSIDIQPTKGIAITSDGSRSVIYGYQHGVEGPDADVFIERIDFSLGGPSWTVVLSSEGEDHLHDLTGDAEYVYAVGYTRGALGGEPSGKSDYFMSKISRDGSPIWTRQWGTPASDALTAVTVDGSGFIYALGYTFEPPSGSGYEGKTMYLTKLDQDGEAVWERYWGSSSTDNPWDVILDQSGELIVTGSTMGAIGDTGFVGGYSDTVVAKFTSEGELVWQIQPGSYYDDVGRRLLVEPSSGLLFLVGSGSQPMSMPLDLSETPGGVDDAYLLLIGADGELLEYRQWSEYYFAAGTSLALYDNMVIIVGYHGIFGGAEESDVAAFRKRLPLVSLSYWDD